MPEKVIFRPPLTRISRFLDYVGEQVLALDPRVIFGVFAIDVLIVHLT